MSQTRRLLLTIHVASAAGSLGASVLGLVILTGEPAAAPPAGLAAAGRLLTGCVLMQALAWGTGLLVAVSSRWGLFRYGWVVKKLCLTSVGLGVQVTLAVRSHQADIRIWELEGGLAVVLLLSLLSTALSIYKPGARAGAARPQSRLQSRSQSRSQGRSQSRSQGPSRSRLVAPRQGVE